MLCVFNKEQSNTFPIKAHLAPVTGCDIFKLISFRSRPTLPLSRQPLQPVSSALLREPSKHLLSLEYWTVNPPLKSNFSLLRHQGTVQGAFCALVNDIYFDKLAKYCNNYTRPCSRQAKFSSIPGCLHSNVWILMFIFHILNYLVSFVTIQPLPLLDWLPACLYVSTCLVCLPA